MWLFGVWVGEPVITGAVMVGAVLLACWLVPWLADRTTERERKKLDARFPRSELPESIWMVAPDEYVRRVPGTGGGDGERPYDWAEDIPPLSVGGQVDRMITLMNPAGEEWVKIGDVPHCETCGYFACVCDIRRVHADGCAFRRAAASPVGIACEHGRDTCPICDPCTCAHSD